MTIARQCTDTGLFTAPDADIASQTEARSGTVFIANSRGFRRDFVQWALETGAPAQLEGHGADPETPAGYRGEGSA